MKIHFEVQLTRLKLSNLLITCQQENLLSIVALQVQIVQREHAAVHALSVARDATFIQATLRRRLHHPLLGLTDNIALHFVGVAHGRLFGSRDRRDGHCVRRRSMVGGGVVVAAGRI